uniref:Uncharacterized protein n=1 Tax=viral metagenome TaxID=1070528 RepID=A0A6H1ZVQ8_9ZZZZ
MAEEVELFDVPEAAFEEAVQRWAIPPDVAWGREVTRPMLRRVISVLARLLWILGQRVKKLEKGE